MNLLLMLPVALADVPPPDDYVETCTPSIQCGELDSKVCSGVRPDDPPEPECDALAAEGYTRMCSAWGGTIYDVVMCKGEPDPAGVAERVAAAEAEASAWCATAGFGAPLGVILLLPLLVRREQG